MEGGNFKPDYCQNYCFARATEVMNSKSSNDFRWSVRFIVHQNRPELACFGIASKCRFIHHAGSRVADLYDENAIILGFHRTDRRFYNRITVENKQKYLINKIISSANEDEIHFRFQSKLKKLSISLVRSIIWITCMFLTSILERHGICYWYQRRRRLLYVHQFECTPVWMYPSFILFRWKYFFGIFIQEESVFTLDWIKPEQKENSSLV